MAFPIPSRLITIGLLLSACGGRRAAMPAADPGAGSRTVVMIGIDGFRADYLERPAARRIRRLADSGVRARWLAPAFPTQTFPNLYTIATGLYPGHHGIVANTMADPVLGRFTTADTFVNRKPAWWGGEPIWITAERQGRRAATMFWVGSEIPFGGRRASDWHSFDARVADSTRVAQVIEWLARPPETRPALITLYLTRVDLYGHRRGPASPAMDSAIAETDRLVGRLVDWITANRRGDQTDLVVLSDHGMTSMSRDRVVFLDDYVDIEPGEIVDFAPATAIEPRPGRLEHLYQNLQGAHPHVTIYRRDRAPARLRLQDGPRFTPLLAVADEGWYVSTRERWKTWKPTDNGNHGFDNQLPSMRAIFIAVGPSFRSGLEVPPFQNIHVYPLLARLLGITPAPVDGSLDSVAAVLR